MSDSVQPYGPYGAHRAPLSMGFSRLEYWSGLPCPSPGIFPTQQSNPCSLCLLNLVGVFFTTAFSCCLQCLQNQETLNQFSSVIQSCVNLCDCLDCSTPDFPVYHQLPELAQTHVHPVSNAIQLSHPLSSPSPPAFNLPQHQSLFQ